MRASDRELLPRADENAAREPVIAEILRKEVAARLGRRRNDVHFTSEKVNWLTPPEILTRVTSALGAIDLDPCSNSGEPNVPARRHFVEGDDGLAHAWFGRVFVNPPYGRVIGQWVNKLRDEFAAGRVEAAIALVPARTDTKWFMLLRDCALCFIRGRLHFSNSYTGAPFPSVVAYFGPDRGRFIHAFEDIGDVWERASIPISAHRPR